MKQVSSQTRPYQTIGLFYRAPGAVMVLLIFFFSLAYAQPAKAQFNDNLGGSINNSPVSECAECVPEDINPCCVAVVTKCTRIDSPPKVTIDNDSRRTAITIGWCSHCGGCPDDPPSYDLKCEGAAEYSFQQASTATIDSRIEVGAMLMKAQLGSALGVTIGETTTVSISCSILARPCTVTSVKAMMQIYEATAVIEHTWLAQGVWTDGNCDLGDCEQSGGGWIARPCANGMSTATALCGRGFCQSGEEKSCDDDIYNESDV